MSNVSDLPLSRSGESFSSLFPQLMTYFRALGPSKCICIWTYLHLRQSFSAATYVSNTRSWAPYAVGTASTRQIQKLLQPENLVGTPDLNRCRMKSHCESLNFINPSLIVNEANARAALSWPCLAYRIVLRKRHPSEWRSKLKHWVDLDTFAPYHSLS